MQPMNFPGSQRTTCRHRILAKARNQSWVASASELKHPMNSEDISYKSRRGEVEMCLRVGRMGSIK